MADPVNNEALAARARDLIAETIGVVRTLVEDDGARLAEDLGADSLDLIELGFALEDELGRVFSDEDLGALKTVGDVVAVFQAEAVQHGG